MDAKDFILPMSEGEKLDFIREHYPHQATKLISIVTGLTESQVCNRANTMRLRKTKEYMASLAASSNLQKHGKAFRFQSGHTPLNKGRRMPRDVYEKVKRTMFKAGHEPSNTKYDGHISLRRDSNGREYLHIRVRKGTYRLLHRIVWEQHYGPIPKGYLVVFKDGNTRNVSIGNLELITRKENALRNTIHRYPKEVASAIRTLSKLNKTIRKYGEKQHG